MKVFIAGVMQGNRKDKNIHSQEYRSSITSFLKTIDKSIDVIDPDKTDPDRLSYTNEQAANMFFRYCDIAAEVDLLISYLPQASMGSAIEMWKAYHAGIPIISITPLVNNWVVKLLSTKVYVSIDEFEKDRKYTDALLQKIRLQNKNA